MAALSNYTEKLLLDWLVTTGAATRPTVWYVALYTAAPSDAGGGTEVSGFNYSRKAITFAAATTPDGTTSNTNTLLFTATGGAWGTISHLGILDALTAGNLLWHGALTTSKTIADGDSIEFLAADIVLALA